MKLLFVSGNKHKFREIKEVLAGEGLALKMKPMELVEPDIDSLEKIAVSKAQQAFEKLRCQLIVEDTGLYFKAYRNFPGVYPKKIYYSIGFEGIFRLLKGKNRQAVFKSTICFIWGKSKFKTFSAEMKGKITSKVFRPKADVLAYDKVFVPEGKKKTIVEMSLAEKNSFSQRGKAAKKLAKFLKRF